MKNTVIYSLLLLWVFAFTCHTLLAQNVNSSSPDNIKQALSKPEKSKALLIDLQTDAFNEFVGSTLKFTNMKELTIVNYTMNFDWDAAFKAFAEIHSLRKLTLKNNNLRTFPIGLLLCDSLKSLTIEGNSSIVWPSAFYMISCSQSICELHLIRNDLGKVPEELGKCKRIKHLEITENYDIVQDLLFDDLAKLTSLENLSLASNGMDDLNPGIGKLTALKYLDISGNYIETLPASMELMTKLEYIDMSGNLMEDLPQDMKPLQPIAIKKIVIDKSTVKADRDQLFAMFPATKFDYVEKKIVNLKGTTISEDFAWRPVNSLVKPPVPELDTRFSMYKQDPEKPLQISSANGSTITIPARAFVDVKGKVVTDDVSVFYREFKNPLEIVLSGVPMIFDSGGVKHSFRTAGMFELTAASKGDEVFLAPDKKIEVFLSSNDTTDNFNLYYLNEEAGTWEYKQPAVVSDNVDFRKFGILSMAYTKYKALFDKVWTFDSTKFSDRWADFSYTRTRKDLRGIVTGDQVKLKVVKNLVKKQIWFAMDARMNTYPELNGLKNYVWVYKGDLKKRDFNNYFAKKNSWRDMRVSYDNGQKLYTIELKAKNSYVSFDAYPRPNSTNTDITRTVKNYDRMYNRYVASLSKVEKRFNERAKKNKEEYSQRYVKNCQNAWSKMRSLMSDEEKAMSYDEWMAYYYSIQDSIFKYQVSLKKAELAMLNKDRANPDNVIRAFSLGGLGVWNCDQIYRVQQPLTAMASFTDSTNKKIYPKTVYVLDKKLNGVLTYTKEITFNPTSSNVIIVVDMNGDLAYAREDEVKRAVSRRLTQRDDLDFVMKVPEKGVRVESLMKSIGFY